MATRRYKISAGMTEFKIVEEVGLPTVSHTIELTVDLAATTTHANGGTRQIFREEVLRALDMIENHIVSGKWPPA